MSAPLPERSLFIRVDRQTKKYLQIKKMITLKIVQVNCSGHASVYSSSIRVEYYGKTIDESATGQCPITSVLSTIRRLLPQTEIELHGYTLESGWINSGSFTSCRVTIVIAGETFVGDASGSTDLYFVLTEAVLCVINSYLVEKTRF